MSYLTALNRVIKEDGISGLMLRGLGTKILANGLSGMLFSVMWKLIDDKFKKLFA